ncbi:transposase [bacterium]|nr:MAG: transposase [bacterium]
MPWRRTEPMEERVHFISDYLKAKYEVSALCEVYGISRKTGHKWISRYRQHGIDGLKDVSRRPHNSPYRTPLRIKKEIIELRKRYGWGPKKLLSLMKSKHPGWYLPGRSTVCDILKREGLIKKRRARRKIPAMLRPFAPIDHPNAVWTADFKGQFRINNGRYCYPLTITDSYSRYLLECRALTSTRLDDVRNVFKSIFEKYGLPERIRTDNGVPFASISASGLSQLSLWWVRLGIYPERIDAGKPYQNGRHERMHRDLKEKTVKPPAASMTAQQVRLDQFCKEYNEVRPHEALNFKTPSSLYKPSNRSMPKNLLAFQYPEHYEVRHVQRNGSIYWRNSYAYVGYLLQDQNVGLEEIDNGIRDVYLGTFLLGRLYDEKMKIDFNRKNIKKV